MDPPLTDLISNAKVDGFVRGDGSVIVPLSPVNAETEDQGGPTKKKTKRVRLLLDARTELTNEELQVKMLPSVI